MKTASTFSRMALERYAGGESHEGVTRWLRESCPDFEQHLSEVVVSGLGRRWVERQHAAYLSLGDP
jgi:hypothetical protein